MTSVKINEDTLGRFQTRDDMPYGTCLVASANSDGEEAECKVIGVGTLATQNAGQQSGEGSHHALLPMMAPQAQCRQLSHFLVIYFRYSESYAARLCGTPGSLALPREL